MNWIDMNVGMHCLFLHLLHLLHSVFDCLISFSFSLCFIIITAIDSVVWLCCIFMSQGCLSKQMTEQINHFHLTTISSISTAKRKFWYHSNSSSSSICLVFFFQLLVHPIDESSLGKIVETQILILL